MPIRITDQVGQHAQNPPPQEELDHPQPATQGVATVSAIEGGSPVLRGPVAQDLGFTVAATSDTPAATTASERTHDRSVQVPCVGWVLRETGGKHTVQTADVGIERKDAPRWRLAVLPNRPPVTE